MDVVYDPVGMVVPSLKCVGWNARLVVVGFAAGTIEKVGRALPCPLSCSMSPHETVAGLGDIEGGWSDADAHKIPANLALLKQVSITGLAFGQTYRTCPQPGPYSHPHAYGSRATLGSRMVAEC